MNNFKISLIQIFSILTIIVINSALVVGYIKLSTIFNVKNIALLDIIDISILLFSVYVFVSNFKIPFLNYNIFLEDNEEASFDDAINEELTYITSHIVASLMLTLSVLAITYVAYL